MKELAGNSAIWLTGRGEQHTVTLESTREWWIGTKATAAVHLFQQVGGLFFFGLAWPLRMTTK